VREWREIVTPDIRDKIMFYLAVGSHNQNYRSSIMDGEVVVPERSPGRERGSGT
jgi:hypothetical protein